MKVNPLTHKHALFQKQDVRANFISFEFIERQYKAELKIDVYGRLTPLLFSILC